MCVIRKTVPLSLTRHLKHKTPKTYVKLIADLPNIQRQTHTQKSRQNGQRNRPQMKLHEKSPKKELTEVVSIKKNIQTIKKNQ